MTAFDPDEEGSGERFQEGPWPNSLQLSSVLKSVPSLQAHDDAF